MRKITAILMILLLFVSSRGLAQWAPLDTTKHKWFTVDNTPNLAGTSTNWEVDRDSTDGYYEKEPNSVASGQPGPGWFTNTGTANVGPDHRRTPFTAGSPSGAWARYIFNIPTQTQNNILDKDDYYILYYYLQQSGNASPNCYITVERFGEGVYADSLRHNQMLNGADLPTLQSAGLWNPTQSGADGSWYPLTILRLNAGAPVIVTIGADTLTPAFLRVDAVRVLRSDLPRDLEFGRRMKGNPWERTTPDTTRPNADHFGLYRVGETFPEVTLGETAEKKVRLFNLGDSVLTIYNVYGHTGRFYTNDPMPIRINPGSYYDLTVVFRPYQEEFAVDSLAIESDDPEEPVAYLHVVGRGLNYNFIMNASDGTEPHWRAPGGDQVLYQEVPTGWSNSVASPYPFPIPGGNRYSRVYTGTEIPYALYQFVIPDTLGGDYILEYSGPAGSPNAATAAQIDVVTPFFADTQRVTGFNERQITTAVLWAQIGGPGFTFKLNPGGPTKVIFSNPGQTSGDFLRTDLLRVRKVPTHPQITVASRNISFGEVAIDPLEREMIGNYRQTITIGSNGEKSLWIYEIRFNDTTGIFKIINMPRLPLELPAINGKFNLVVEFAPRDMKTYVDTLFIVSNSKFDSVLTIRFTGTGRGTLIYADNDVEGEFYAQPRIVDYVYPPVDTTYDKWNRVVGSGINNSRLLAYIYGAPNAFAEWYPFIPLREGASEVDSFDVYARTGLAATNSTPRARYLIYQQGGAQPETVIVSQNGAERIYLGRFQFRRGGRDFTMGSKQTAIFGYIRLENDTALVSAYYADSLINRAKIDSFVIRADAIEIREAPKPTKFQIQTSEIPKEFYLAQNYPNPFNPSTDIEFSIPIAVNVEIKVYDVLGREVATLINETLQPGKYKVRWNGTDRNGALVSSGVYFYVMKAGKFIQTRKMMLLK
jgi:hypothetical protein